MERAGTPETRNRRSDGNGSGRDPGRARSGLITQRSQVQILPPLQMQNRRSEALFGVIRRRPWFPEQSMSARCQQALPPKSGVQTCVFSGGERCSEAPVSRLVRHLVNVL